jgi:pilus assembly protein CpaC
MACSLSALVVFATGWLSKTASATDYPAPGATTQAGMKFLPLGIGKSVVIDLPRDVKDVLVADPKIANAVVRSAQRAYIIGVTVGQTNVFFFDSEGQQIAGYDIAVKRDLNGIRAAIKQSFPGTDVQIEGVGNGVILSGNVSSAVEAQQIGDIATRLVGGNANEVVNSIVIRGRDQVMLKVTVAELQRDVIKQLGIDINGSLNYGTAVLNFNNNNPFPINGGPLVTSNAITGSMKSVSATVRAMERAGVAKLLAEPNLTAISGEAATFIAGGEFPVPSGYTCDPTTRVCNTQITFKKFGISLNFTPVVMSEGRISLRVMNEVSELSQDNALTLTQLSNTLVIPSIKTRRAETTLEIPSGGSMALAGLIHEQTKQQINGLPGLMQLPILGTLFKSRDFINRQTELVIIVTPYVVRAVAQKELSRPADGFTDAADPSTVLLSNFNKIYGAPGAVRPRENYRGKYGFILD